MSRCLFEPVCLAMMLAACGGGGAASSQPTDAATATELDASDASAGCTDNLDCKVTEFCSWTAEHACGRDHAGGTCTPIGPRFCPDLGFWVCGCDGVTYTNECHTESLGVAVDYGGPCRPAGTFLACQTSADCPADDPEFPQFCVDDPRDACDPATGACAGMCIHGTYLCGPTLPCQSQTQDGAVESPGTEACIAVTPGSVGPDDSGQPGRCVYTTRRTCHTVGDCETGELCMAELGCDPATTSCPSVCVRP